MARSRGHQLRGVAAARSIECKDSAVGGFLGRVRQSIGSVAVVKRPSQMRLTYLESVSVGLAFSKLGYQPKQTQQFRRELDGRMVAAGYRAGQWLKVDPMTPICWTGRTDRHGDPLTDAEGKAVPRHQLAINLMLTDELSDQRAIVEEFSLEQFGQALQLRRFVPHVTFAEILPEYRSDYCSQDPLDFMPDREVDAPQSIMSRGLFAYFGSRCPGR